MIEERRVRRSERRGEALCFQLEASAKRAGADFMLLASSDGLLVACSDEHREASEEVAARLAALDLDPSSSGELWSFGREVVACAFEHEGESFILGASGSRPSSQSELSETLRGVVRILS